MKSDKMKTKCKLMVKKFLINKKVKNLYGIIIVVLLGFEAFLLSNPDIKIFGYSVPWLSEFNVIIITILAGAWISTNYFEEKSKNELYSSGVYDVLANEEFFIDLSDEAKEKFYDAVIRKKVIGKDFSGKKDFYDGIINKAYSIDDDGAKLYHALSKKIADQVKNAEYYFPFYEYKVKGRIYENYLIKEVSRTVDIKAFTEEAEYKETVVNLYCAEENSDYYLLTDNEFEDFVKSTLPFAKWVKERTLKEGINKAFEIYIGEEGKLQKKLKTNEYTVTMKDIPESEMREGERYTKKIEVGLKNAIKISNKNSVEIIAKYRTVVTFEDPFLINRVKAPCKSYRFEYELEHDSGYCVKIIPMGFTNQGNTTHQEPTTKDDIAFNDWINKGDGATAFVYKKQNC